MRPRSIRLRLLLAAAVGLLVALVGADFGLSYLFERHVERTADAMLAGYVDLIAGNLAVADDKPVLANPPVDPRFQRPLSGLYWQVSSSDGVALLTSRSLWDATLPTAPLPDRERGEHGHGDFEIRGPQGGLLRAVERPVTIATSSGPQTYLVLSAIDHRQISSDTADFGADVAPFLVALALAFIVVLWIQVTVGLVPLERLRQAVARVAAGRARALDVEVPSEVQPLVTEINSLLSAQEAAIERARARAADLAHGMKTPLQVLAAEIRTLRDKGETAVADEIETVANSLQRHVDRELARARTGLGAQTHGARTVLRDVVARVLAVLERTPAGGSLTLVNEVPESLVLCMDETDALEMIGNLAENACRFARGRVAVAAAAQDSAVEVTVSDDGPGIPEEQRREVMRRGVRLDSRGEGSGLGLAIVSETVESYGGTLSLENAAPGLRVRVTMPCNRNAPLS
ncbi:MAG TPA: HAMP domain-containing sensor histidine kinase [Bauldia sp.]|nr:HAMP domain-containing sensor histidine kinase [Bauldia sp.]